MNPLLLQLYPALAAVDANIRVPAMTQAQIVTVPTGTVLFDERQPCRGFPFILSGGVRVMKATANGRELPLYRVLAGETCIITSSCLLGHADYNARGVTEKETELVFLPRDQFDVLLTSQPFRDFVFQLFAERCQLL